jgi:hypothetical protein
LEMISCKRVLSFQGRCRCTLIIAGDVNKLCPILLSRRRVRRSRKEVIEGKV